MSAALAALRAARRTAVVRRVRADGVRAGGVNSSPTTLALTAENQRDSTFLDATP